MYTTTTTNITTYRTPSLSNIGSPLEITSNSTKYGSTCAIPHCNLKVECCFKHSCPDCGAIKSSKTPKCPSCSHTTPSTINSTNNHTQPAQVQIRYVPTSQPRSIPESSLVRCQRKFETQHSALYYSLYDGVASMEKVALKPENQKSLVSESQLHSIVDHHPNVVRNYGMCNRSNGEVSMVVEMLDGDLTDRLIRVRNQTPFEPEKWIASLGLYLVQAARGLRHIHRHGIMHRDICANNLLMDGEVVKVSDFGLAKRTDDKSPSGLPYPMTTAPEVLRHLDDCTIWSTKADAWQFGLLICEVMTFGQNPLQEFNVSVKALVEALDRNWLPEKPKHCPDALWRLALLCLQQDHRLRPEFEELVPRIESVAAAMQKGRDTTTNK